MILWQVQAAAQEAADLEEVHVVAVAAHVAVFQEVLEVLVAEASAEDITAEVSMVGIIPHHQDITITDHFSMVATTAVDIIITIMVAVEFYLHSLHSSLFL